MSTLRGFLRALSPCTKHGLQTETVGLITSGCRTCGALQARLDKAELFELALNQEVQDLHEVSAAQIHGLRAKTVGLITSGCGRTS